MRLCVSALHRFCRERPVTDNVPRHWEFPDELPRLPLDTVLRH